MTKARDLANASTALGAVSATELAFVDGVTSAIQTQIDAKAPSSTAATLTGTQTLTNKTIDTASNTITGAVTLTGTQTLTNKTLTNPVIASVVNNTLIDAKGDIITATAADTPARLAVGANDTVLTAASGEATGLKWSTPSGAAPYLVQKVVNNWYGLQGGTGANATPVEDTTYFIPIYLNAGTYDRLRLRVGSNGGTQIDVRLGIYNSSSTTGLPTTVSLDAGVVTTENSSSTYDITINKTLTSGFYYLAFNAQGNNPFGQNYATYGNFGLNDGPAPAGVGFMNDGSWNFNNALNFPRVASVTGAFGTVSSISSYGGNAPWVMIRLAS